MNKNIHMLISSKAEEIKEDVIKTRRHLHMYPELPGKEKETSRFIARKLRALGLEVHTDIGGYGIVGILIGGKSGATIAWRADMDACAIQEENDKPYKSKIGGVMHACGHDAHSAIALGIAETLASIKENICGTIKFIFQPAEEGLEGAQKMIADGVLENPRPSAIYGLHQGSLGAGQSYMESGELSIIYGTALFGIDRLNISVKSTRPKFNGWAEQELFIYKLVRVNCFKNKHGKRVIDNLVDFQVTQKEANDETGEVRIQARFRYAMQEYRNDIREELAKIIKEYEQQTKSEVTVEYIKSTPPVYNNENECAEAEMILKKLTGNNVIPIYDEIPPHGADDFACFQNELSGLFFFLGSANLEQGIKAWNHTPTFDMDEDCLVFGVKTMSSFLFEILERRKSV
jgi:metal-dependent amidase/aminoacylase/carboxypeptidase family protein